MELEELSLNALSSRIESSIYRNLCERIGDRLDDLIQKERELQKKNRRLVSYLRDYHRSKNDDYAHSEIIQKIIKGFPRLPMHSSQLAVRLLDENVSAGEVVNLTRFDPSLMTIVLKTVNSAYYNLQRKVSDIQRAVLLLGFNQVYQLIVTEGLRSIMPDGQEFQELLFHSILVSLLSFEIAQISHLKRGERHGTIGLLHDIGKSIILLLKQEYSKLRAIVDIVGHSRIGSLLLKEWNIPEAICITLEYQSYPEFSPPEEIPEECRVNVAVLYLAHLCEGHLQGKWEEDSYSPFHREYLGLLNLSEMSIQEFVRSKVLPSMTRKLNTFPENVRAFLMESESRLTEKDRPDSE
jgi:HD-like signal output (HDOD) protein